MTKTTGIVLAAVLAFGTVACSETNEAVNKTQKEANQAASEAESAANDAQQAAEDVNWDKYPKATQKKIEAYAAKDNCNGLNGELDKLDPKKDAPLMAYLKATIAEAGCA